MRPTVKKLTDLEIDEVSLVDRPANQHGLVAIAKRGAEEEAMPEIYDAEGYPVAEDELQPGDFVYDADGTEYEVKPDADDGTSGQFDDGYADEGAYEGELVGKGVKDLRAAASGRWAKTRATWDEGWKNDRARRAQRAQQTTTQTGAPVAGESAPAGGGQSALRRYGPYAAGGTAVVGGGGAYVHHRRSRTAKSLGSQVYEELSKALDDGDRDVVIAKAMDLVDEAGQRAARAERIAKSMADERELEEFVELAKGYDLPVDPEDLGLVLKHMADALPDDELALIDRLLSSVSDDRFVQKGYAGDLGPSEVMDQVQALALDAVSKADISPAEAVVGLFETNPEAYDMYLAEQRR